MSPGRIAVGYAALSILWIALSDALVTRLKLHPALLTIKGTAFVLVTASLLYFTIRRLVQAVQLTSQQRDQTADLYRTVAEASNEGICLLDESGRISFLNGRLAAMLGRPAEELHGKRLQDFIEEPHVLAQPGSQGSETHECRLRTDSEPKPWVVISRHPILNDAGDVAGLVVTIIDISERQRAEKAVRWSDAHPAEVPGAPENLKESLLASPARYGLAVFAVALTWGLSLLLEHFHFRAPSAPFLFAIAISSWYGGAGPGALAVILCTLIFEYYFAPPVHSFRVYWSEIPYFVTFITFAVLMAWFGAVRRRVEAGLQEQAALLNLTHDTVFVMDMDGVIKFWNRGAEEQYGWPAEKVVGRVVHDLLKTVFPRPLQEIKAELIATGRWEGELLHTNKHGTLLVVASRWSLQRDRRGAPFAILETNNDISERKRAEEALSRLNRELRAISYCNQALLRATDEHSLVKEICRIIHEEAGYSLAWVGYAEHDEAKSLRPVAWSGVEEGFLTTAGLTWADTETGQRPPAGIAVRTGQTIYMQDFATEPRIASWREIFLQHDFLSGIGLPLKDEHGNAFGSLTIYSAQSNAFTPKEIRLLEELAGDLAFGIVTLRSQAARKQVEQEVNLLSFALNNVREAAFLIDDTARFHYVNDEACRVLGYTRAELLGMGVPDIDPAFPMERWSDHWRDLRAQRSLSFESRHRTRHGRIFPVEVSANYFEYGGHVYSLALVRDISERKAAETALRESETRFRTFVDHAGDALFVQDLESGIIVDVNRSASESLGCTQDELIGKTPGAFHLDSDRAHLKSITERAAAGETVFDTHWHRRKDGTLFPVEVHTSRVSYGGQGYLLKVARDITDRMRAEEQRERLRQLQADLAHVNRVSMLGELAASVSHELKQPIAGAALQAEVCSQWLRRDPPDVHKAGEATGRIIDAANRANDIIDRLRSLYRKSSPKRELVDVNQTIHQMVALLLGEANRHGVSIRSEVAEGLPQIKADAVQLQQVLMNLMLNGIEAMHDTGGVLTVKSQLAQDGRVEISVSDTGVGLPAGKADLIFNAFFTTKARGSGMGLSISRSIVESHGGRIWATSNDGRGASFHFALPIAAEAPVPAAVS